MSGARFFVPSARPVRFLPCSNGNRIDAAESGTAVDASTRPFHHRAAARGEPK